MFESAQGCPTLLHESRTTVISLPHTDYGSLRTERLEQLLAQLDGLAVRCNADIVLDLSAVKLFGASFLNALLQFRKNLGELGKKLRVCGDNTGVIRLTGLESAFSLTPGSTRP